MEKQKEVGNEKKSRSRKVKEIHIEIIPDECQTKAAELIKLFVASGIPESKNNAK